MTDQSTKLADAAGDIDEAAQAGLVKQLSMMIGALFGSPVRNVLLLLNFALVAVILVTAYGQIRLNSWNQPFYDALSRRDLADFLIQLGVFGNHYSARFGDARSDSGGVTGNVGYNWTQVLHSNLSASVQQTDFKETRDNGNNFDVKSHPWSAVFSTVYDAGQLTKYSFYLGRSIAPSSVGGLSQIDQARAQYDHDFTQRLHLTSAVRVFRDKAVSGVSNANYRNYATGNIRVQYMLTQRIFVATAYTYVYQKYKLDPASADANVFNVSFGYRGLERQH